MTFDYHKVSIDEINRVMEIIEDARELLKLEGNGQWQFGYPNRNDLIDDINLSRLYGVYFNDILISVCAISGYEEAYHHLYEGKWLSNLEYLVMHRVAISKDYRGKGLGHHIFYLFDEVSKEMGIKSLRIDTHENNHIMRHLMESHGFIYCGKVILPPNKDRVVYEKIIK